MGCCLSTATNRRQPDNSKLRSEPTLASHSFPPAFEEETVKEVLSETPIVPKTPTGIIKPEENITESESGVVDVTKTPTEEIQENVSEMSEMYSFSESFSAATTATMSASVADNKKDEIEVIEDGEVTQKVRTKSPPVKRVTRKQPMVPSGEVSGRKERVVRPPVRKHMVPSPEKKRQSPSRATMNAQRPRNAGQANDSRREVTARRSRSPAVRGEVGQRRKVRERSPVDKSGDVKPVRSGEREERSTVEVEKVDDGGVSPEPEPQTNESLENPLVSLECFIFL